MKALEVRILIEVDDEVDPRSIAIDEITFVDIKSMEELDLCVLGFIVEPIKNIHNQILN